MCFISANGSIGMQFENIPIKLPIYYCKWPFLNSVLPIVPCMSSSFTKSTLSVLLYLYFQ